jgi:hypothetical protein
VPFLAPRTGFVALSRDNTPYIPVVLLEKVPAFQAAWKDTVPSTTTAGNVGGPRNAAMDGLEHSRASLRGATVLLLGRRRALEFPK